MTKREYVIEEINEARKKVLEIFADLEASVNDELSDDNMSDDSLSDDK